MNSSCRRTPRKNLCSFDSYIESAGIANRTLVLIDEDGVVAWTYESPSPGEFPGPDIVRQAISA